MRISLFPARFEELDNIREFVGEMAAQAGMDAKEIYEVQLAVDEAASNVIEHAYQDVDDGQLEISCQTARGMLSITISDQGRAFNPEAVDNPDLEATLEDRAIGGLGLFLIRKLMDRVEYQTSPEKGNRLTMVKYRGGAKSRQQQRMPAWRKLLRLGDELLSALDFAEQSQQIVVMAQQLVRAEVELWLDESMFRLPSWSAEPIFLPTPPTSLMRNAHEDRTTIVVSTGNSFSAAFPLQNQDIVLGVLQVRRTEGKPISPTERHLLEALSSHAALALMASHRVAVERFRIEQLSLVRTVSAQIADVGDIDELTRRVVRLIQTTFKYYYVAIFTLSPGETSLRFRASAGAVSGKRGKPSPALEVSVGQGLIGQAAQSGEEILANDARQTPLFRHIDSLPETQSEFVIPLKIEDRVLGVLDVQSDALNAFHPNDLLVLRALAGNVAIALEGAQLYASLRRRADEMQMVAEVGRQISSILDLPVLMKRVAHLIQERFGFPYVHLFTVHPNRRQIHYEAGSGAKSEALEGYTLSLDDPEGLVPWVARQAQSVLLNDVDADPRYRPTPLPPANTCSELTIPLIFNESVLGVLDIQSDVPNAFTEDDRLLFETLGISVASAIRNADLYHSEQWRRRVADSLREVAVLLSNNASTEEVLNSILTELERTLPSDIATIWLLGEDDIYCAAVHGANAADLEAARRDVPEAALALTRALFARTPVVRKPDDPMGPSAIAGGYSPDHSSIAAPLRIGDQAVGILSLTHHTPGRYGHEAHTITTTFASYAAVAIENARLYNMSQEQAYASAALLQVAQAVVSLSQLDEILSTIVRVLPILVGVQRAILYVWDKDTETLRAAEAYDLSEEAHPYLWKTLALADFPLLDSAIQSGMPALSPDAHLDPHQWLTIQPFSHDEYESALQAEDRLLMAFPLLVKNDLFGVLLAEEALGGRRFRSRRIEILTGVAQQAALAIQNDIFQSEMLLRERLELEVQLARQIQRTFLPETLPMIAGWEISAMWKTARQVGGDFYDVIHLAHDKIGFFIADVADKGVPAALFMALTRTLVRAAVLETLSPAEALRRVNDLLYPDAHQGMFVTAFYGVLDTITGEFTYTNAGHNPPYWCKPGEERVEALTRTGMALGVMEGAQMQEARITLAPGDALLLYTDGVTEAFSPEGELFGEARLQAMLPGLCQAPDADLLEDIERALDEFMDIEPPSDDITMLAIRRDA
jgi:serine phosphatase RsbU (regulator of sigma subunit)/anti-sigma regulatory factor (Ser/Thr protein kinase)/putative methionine-R-sulfoxide reductase with GAF domain